MKVKTISPFKTTDKNVQSNAVTKWRFIVNVEFCGEVFGPWLAQLPHISEVLGLNLSYGCPVWSLLVLPSTCVGFHWIFLSPFKNMYVLWRSLKTKLSIGVNVGVRVCLSVLWLVYCMIALISGIVLPSQIHAGWVHPVDVQLVEVSKDLWTFIYLFFKLLKRIWCFYFCLNLKLYHFFGDFWWNSVTY